ncbi:MAG: hypothetical protein GY944_27235 [bacterium]|nr:hypothetical protein [bacterium]
MIEIDLEIERVEQGRGARPTSGIVMAPVHTIAHGASTPGRRRALPHLAIRVRGADKKQRTGNSSSTGS